MIGFDIGGTKCGVCIGRETVTGAEITDKITIPTDHGVSAYEMIERMCAAAEKMTREIDVIGISCGGPIDSQNGVIMSPPNLPGWDEIKIVEYLKTNTKQRFISKMMLMPVLWQNGNSAREKVLKI